MIATVDTRQIKKIDPSLAERRICISTHLLGQASRECSQITHLLAQCDRAYYIDEYQYTDEELIEVLKEHRVDTFLLWEYVGMIRNAYRKRMLRNAGINVWHVGLGVLNHYHTYRLDWDLYGPDTYLRYMTSEAVIKTDKAIETEEPINRILVIGQKPGDQALRFGGYGYDNRQMVLETAANADGKAEIMYRPHPKYFTEHRSQAKKMFEDNAIRYPIPEVIISEHRTLDQDLYWADVVVTVNSTTSYEVLDRGMPVYYAGIGHMNEHWSGSFCLHELGLHMLNKRLPQPDYVEQLQANVRAIQQPPRPNSPEGDFWAPGEFVEFENKMIEAFEYGRDT